MPQHEKLNGQVGGRWMMGGPPEPDGSAGSLRRLAFRGGAYMTARQIVGMAINTAGMLLLTQQIGPSNYGIYISALGIFTYLSFVSQCGLDIYLIRREGPTEDQDYHLGFTLLLALGVTGAVLGALLLPVIGQWVGVPGFTPLAIALLAGLPVNLLTLIPTARMERALDYRRLSIVELLNILVYQAVSLSSAYAAMGAWSPVIGWWVQQVFALALLYSISRFRPRFYWNASRAKTMLSYGVGYAGSISIWQMRSLIGPFLLLPAAGPSAVAYVGLATRFVDLLSFAKTATWRLSIATLARVQADSARALSAITDGMRLQVLLLGPPLVGFSMLGPYVMPIVFGDRWAEWSGAMDIFPYIALGVLCNAIFSLHSSMLFVLHRNGLVALFHAAHVTLLFASAAYLLPRHGIVGLGYAEIVAMASYVVIHRLTARVLGTPGYSLAAAWALAAALLLFWPQLGPVACTGVIAVAFWPRTWRTLDGYVRMVLAHDTVSHA